MKEKSKVWHYLAFTPSSSTHTSEHRLYTANKAASMALHIHNLQRKEVNKVWYPLPFFYTPAQARELLAALYRTTTTQLEDKQVDK